MQAIFYGNSDLVSFKRAMMRLGKARLEANGRKKGDMWHFPKNVGLWDFDLTTAAK